MGILDLLEKASTTSNIIIVSRTRMSGDYICVGAFDVDKKRSIRLLTSSEASQISSFPLKIGDTVRAAYVDRQSGTRPPHTEDVILQNWDGINSVPVADLLSRMCPIVSGDINNTFDGCLSGPGGGALSIGSDNTPNHSVCFWTADMPLVLDTRFDNNKYTYGFGYKKSSIKYVGLEDTIPIIPAGTIIRLSLSRWWRPPGGTEERCFLQLSGWYSPVIAPQQQGKGEPVTNDELESAEQQAELGAWRASMSARGYTPGPRFSSYEELSDWDQTNKRPHVRRRNSHGFEVYFTDNQDPDPNAKPQPLRTIKSTTTWEDEIPF